MTSEIDNLKLHFKYCAFILVMVIIAVATDRWTAQKDFTTYLSNAATMTSLVLGLVAIFYSFISNDSLSKSLGSITTISGEVKDTKDQIARYVALTTEASAATERNSALLQDASGDVTAAVDSLDGTLQAIADQNKTLQELVAQLPTRLDQLESKVVEAIGEKPAQPQIAVSASDVTSNAIERFLGRPSLSYNLLTYACVLAGSKGKPLSINAICKALSLEQPSTMNGFVMCMNAIQLLSRKSVDGQSKVYSISAVHPDLNKRTKDYILGYIEQAYSEKPKEKDEWLKKLQSIEALFVS